MQIKPAGAHHSSWFDDYAVIVKGAKQLRHRRTVVAILYLTAIWIQCIGHVYTRTGSRGINYKAEIEKKEE